MNCPNCGHAPIMHIQDGGYITCRVCHMLADSGNLNRFTSLSPVVCHNAFRFKLPRVEREQAAGADKESYPPKTVCAVADCGMEWQAHMGYLCPSGDSVFLPLLDCDLPYLYGELE